MSTHRYRHIARASRVPRPSEIRKLWADCAAAGHGFNAKTALVITAVLGSMPFFWFANILALCSLPAVLSAFDSEVMKGALGLAGFFPTVIQKASLIALVAWLAQTYIQLVALPVLQVSNNAQMTQQESHTSTILDELDTDTEGGLRTILDAIDGLPARVAEACKVDQTGKPGKGAR